MKKILKENKLTILYITLLFILSCFFICTEEDLFYVVSNKFKGFDDFYKYSEGFILSTSLISLIIKFKIIRVIFITTLLSSLIYIIYKLINKENKSIPLLGLYLIILFPSSIFKLCTNSYYIVNYLLPIIFSIIYINFLVRNNLQSLKPYICFIFGYIVSLINPVFTIMFLIVSLIVLFYKIIKKENSRNHLTLFLGCIAGAGTVMYGYNYSNSYAYIPNIVEHIFHTLVPLFYTKNTFSFIFITIILLLSINIIRFKSKKLKLLTILSDVVIILYTLGHFINMHYYLTYILYILFTISSIFILLNFNNSCMFKRKIIIYYVFKIVYVLILLSQNLVNETSISFIYVIDVLIILDILNFIYPKNYLYITLNTASILTLILLIFIYADSFYKNEYIKNQIKRDLPCNIHNIKLDKRYKRTSPYTLIPSDDYKPYYLEYYKINSKDYFVIE